MIRFFLLLLVATALLAGPALAQHKLERGAALPEELPASLKDVVQADGFRIVAGGKPFIEIWLNKALNAEDQPAGFDVVYTGFPEGSFLGVWRYVTDGSDFRGQRMKPGLYAMRYSHMPADGNHMGAAPIRDFVVLTPVSADSDPSTTPNYLDLMSLARKASGTGHPGSYPMVTPDGTEETTLVVDTHQHTILKTKIPLKDGKQVPFHLTVAGRGEH
jgi:hypothetical protein